ncbi:hypothetical protein D9611_012331 [Ephemerocybe angulata]|uniref:Uncharacterized protein n=1 Tax=Ephemerocybe angulata TaxID=980116 RepID=A0A8H5CE20_9AGAR|nr:hypothetical protein D9611_012331 [Tulosesus angulatus]
MVGSIRSKCPTLSLPFDLPVEDHRPVRVFWTLETSQYIVRLEHPTRDLTRNELQRKQWWNWRRRRRRRRR